MGVIQQGINQLIGTAAIAARLSPNYEINQQIKAAQAEKDRAIKESQTLASEESDTAKRIMKSAELGLPEKIAQKNKELASYGAYSPSAAAEASKQAKIHAGVAKGLEQGKLKIVPFDIKELQEQKGQVRAQQEATKQLKQKRKFSDYLSKLPTSLGGTVGDLPKSMQQAIAKQYSKSERQKLMNEMDKEGKK